MGWQPGEGGGTGADPDRGSRVPGGAPPARDPRLDLFASVGGRDAIVPSGLLALAADEVSGSERRCRGANGDELTGLLRAWAAVESWAAGAKLAVIAELIRRDDGGPGPRGPGSGGSSGTGASAAGRALQPRPPDLVIPLVTLLGLAERPGEVQGFGLLDPALARDMAAAAAASPRTRICVTVTSQEGYAIGHGCARPGRALPSPQAVASPGAAPARLNLTVSATALAGLAVSAGPWTFTPRGATGPPGGTDPPDGYGTWTLVLPNGRRLTVRLDVVPTIACDHRYETHGYHPSARLRHLVQVRDGTCTFPPCNRHARDSDFEHAIPYEKGGKTCSCNAGARSRACHRVKQAKGWNVSQLRPGWHQWTTPSGRVYVQEPKRYLA